MVNISTVCDPTSQEDTTLAGKNVRVTKESESGRNQRFQVGNRNISRAEFVKEIKQGRHPEYHVREVNDVPTPASNPDRSKSNNLG